MSRASVRAAVTAYMQPPAVSGLNVVLSTQPRDLGGIEWGSGAPGQTDGAIGIVFVRSQDELPKVFDGAGGGRETVYVVEFRLFHRSVQPDAKDAMDAFDSLVDAVCTHLRSDPWLGLGQANATAQGLISAAHEGLSVEHGDPELLTPDGGAIETWAVIRFPVHEWNQPT